MKTSIKFATGLILAAAALVASGSAALAGEGGAAGSVSIKFAGTLSVPNGAPANTPASPDVSRLSTSVAVGKNYAVATAFTSGENTLTSAAGAGGDFVLANANVATANFTANTGSDTLGTAQNNSFAGSGPTTLAPATGVTLAD
jgi:hypothetical protein